MTIADNNASVWTLIPSPQILGSHLEDQSDTAGESANLGPNQGGQNYDAEFMAAAMDEDYLYLAIVIGQRPDNGFASFAPGDVRIVTSVATYGLEIGGGAGGQDGAMLSGGAAGSTYTLNSHGVTTGHADADVLQTAGSLWSGVEWLLDPIAPQGPVQFVITDGSTQAATAEYRYTRNSLTAQHAIIELAIPRSAFQATEKVSSIHWRPSCGNDELDVTPINREVPEPATVGLLIAGGFMFTIRRRTA